MEIRTEKLSHEVSGTDGGCARLTASARGLQIFEWGDKNVAQTDNLLEYA